VVGFELARLILCGRPHRGEAAEGRGRS
jgi:hypothetical protein